MAFVPGFDAPDAPHTFTCAKQMCFVVFRGPPLWPVQTLFQRCLQVFFGAHTYTLTCTCTLSLSTPPHPTPHTVALLCQSREAELADVLASTQASLEAMQRLYAAAQNQLFELQSNKEAAVVVKQVSRRTQATTGGARPQQHGTAQHGTTRQGTPR